MGARSSFSLYLALWGILYISSVFSDVDVQDDM